MRGVQDDVSEKPTPPPPPTQPSHQHETLHKVQSVLFSTSLPAMLAGIFLIFVRFFIPGVLVLTTHHVVYTNGSRGCREPGSV